MAIYIAILHGLARAVNACGGPPAGRFYLAFCLTPGRHMA
jgi:hypothetical protein